MSQLPERGAVSIAPEPKPMEGALSLASATPLATALAVAVERALAKRARGSVGRRTGIDLNAPPALLTIAQALDVMKVNDTAGRAFLEVHGLIGWYAGQKRVALARLMAAGYPDSAANDDQSSATPEPDGVQFAEDML